MAAQRRQQTVVAVLTSKTESWWRSPRWADALASPGASVVTCATAAHLHALLRSAGRLAAVLIDAEATGVHADLIADIVRSGAAVHVRDRPPYRLPWTSLGAAIVPDGAAGLPTGLPAPSSEASRATGSLGHLVAVMGPCERTQAMATVVAETVARLVARATCGTTVLADLTLTAPHRSDHQLSATVRGLPELLQRSRFGAVEDPLIARGVAVAGRSYRLVPGLQHPRDWLHLGRHSTEAALLALRRAASVTVAHIDDDLEGERQTGAFDIEDRNRLARTTATAADLLLVVGTTAASSLVHVRRTADALLELGVDPDRIAIAITPRPRALRARTVAVELQRPWDRGVQRPPVLVPSPIGAARRAIRPLLVTALARAPWDPCPARSAPTAVRVVPGELGHWDDGDDGWITPSTPQQP